MYISDNKYIYDNNIINVQGWATDKKGNSLESISLYCNNQFIGKARLGLLREDVLNVHPELRNDKSGFIFTNRLSKPLISPTEITLKLKTIEGTAEKFSVKFLIE